ncbi:hypothetical protein D3C76_541020 [compost metagenome]
MVGALAKCLEKRLVFQRQDLQARSLFGQQAQVFSVGCRRGVGQEQAQGVFAVGQPRGIAGQIGQERRAEQLVADPQAGDLPGDRRAVFGGYYRQLHRQWQIDAQRPQAAGAHGIGDVAGCWDDLKVTVAFTGDVANWVDLIQVLLANE